MLQGVVVVRNQVEEVGVGGQLQGVEEEEVVDQLQGVEEEVVDQHQGEVVVEQELLVEVVVEVVGAERRRALSHLEGEVVV